MFHFCETPFGILKIGHEEGSVISAALVDRADGPHTPSPVSELAAAQFLEYCSGTRRSFDFPMALRGTLFQLSVWEALPQIPYGETRTYGQIAAAIGKPGAARAVGMACRRNPIWIAIPCHRVVGSNRTLTGYAGGLELKKQLLQLEQRNQ